MAYKSYTYQKQSNKLPWFDVEVISVDEVRLFQTERTKTTITVRELITNKERQCVYWSDKKINVGDILQIQGWKKEDVFIISKCLRIKKGNG